MPHERSPRGDPIVIPPSNQPPCGDNFITTSPMSVIVDISIRKKYITLVQTTQGETLLKVQKSKVSVGLLHTRRPQYCVYSAKGKELVLSCDKKHKWTFTWPKQPHKQCKIKQHNGYCNAHFTDAPKDKLRVEMGSSFNEITKKATGKTIATVRSKRWQWSSSKYVVIMDQGVDISLMTGFLVCTAEILARKAASNARGYYGGGGGAAACTGGGC